MCPVQMFSHELTQSNQSCLSDQMVETKQVCLGSPGAQMSLDSQGAQESLGSQVFLSMFLHSPHLEKL